MLEPRLGCSGYPGDAGQALVLLLDPAYDGGVRRKERA